MRCNREKLAFCEEPWKIRLEDKMITKKNKYIACKSSMIRYKQRNLDKPQEKYKKICEKKEITTLHLEREESYEERRMPTTHSASKQDEGALIRA